MRLPQSPLALVFVLLLGLYGCRPAEIALMYCDAQVGAPSVEVSGRMEPAVLFNDKSRAQIEADLAYAGKPVGPGQARGTTTAAYTQQIELSAEKLVRGPGFVCTQPRVSLALSVPGPRIDIARELAPGTCRYQSTLEHELQHVAAYEQHLERSRQALTRAILARFATGYYFAQDTQALEQQFETDVQSWLAPLISAQLARGQTAQRAIDSPAEYRRLTAACPPDERLLPHGAGASPP